MNQYLLSTVSSLYQSNIDLALAPNSPAAIESMFVFRKSKLILNNLISRVNELILNVMRYLSLLGKLNYLFKINFDLRNTNMDSIAAGEFGAKARSILDWYKLLTVDSKYWFNLFAYSKLIYCLHVAIATRGSIEYSKGKSAIFFVWHLRNV